MATGGCLRELATRWLSCLLVATFLYLCTDGVGEVWGVADVEDYQCNRSHIALHCHTDPRHINANGTSYFMFVSHTSCTWLDARMFCEECHGSLAVLRSPQATINADLKQWEDIIFNEKSGTQTEAWLGYKHDKIANAYKQAVGTHKYASVPAGAVRDALDKKCLLSSLDDDDTDTSSSNNCQYDLADTYLFMRRQLASSELLHFFGDRSQLHTRKHFMCEIPVAPKSTTEYTGRKYTLFQGYQRYYEINAEGILVIGDLVPADAITTEAPPKESRDTYRFWHVTIPAMCGLIVLFIVIFIICKVQRPHDF